MSRSNYVVYDSTGKIISTGSCLDIYVPNQATSSGLTALDTTLTGPVDQKACYVLNGVITPKPACPVTETFAGWTITLSNVPIGATITVSGEAQLTEVAEDATVTLTFGAAGVYNVHVSCFPVLDYSGSFTLT